MALETVTSILDRVGRRKWQEKLRATAARMDWFRGLRAALALSTPLLLADVTGLTHMGWVALGGIEAIVSDSGGPYRSRLNRIGLLTLGGTLAIFLGSMVGGDLRWALPVTCLFCFVWTYLAVFGQPFTSAGLLIQVIYICGVGEPAASLKDAALRAAYLFLGCLWAMLLSLFLWPIDPYRPARFAVADCYRELAAFLADIERMMQAPPDSLLGSGKQWIPIETRHKRELRRLIERAWEMVASVRSQAMAETAHGRQLVVLLESVDLVLERTVACADFAQGIELAQEACTSVVRRMAAMTEAENEVATILTRRRPRRREQSEQIRSAINTPELRLETCGNDPVQRSQSPDTQIAKGDPTHLEWLLAEIASNLDTALESAQSVRLGAQSAPSQKHREDIAGRDREQPDVRQTSDSSTAQAWSIWTGQWNRKSLLMRHAIRVALVCGFDICLIDTRHVGHGYWLMITSLIVLQPHVSGTLRKGMQRIGGTVGGGILAALLALVLHSQLVTGIVLFPLALLALALLPVNYAAYSFFVTPAFVLAFMPRTGDWQLAVLRVGNTVAGAAIAIAAMTVLFPSIERERLAGYLRASLVANRLYLEQLMRSWQTANTDPRPLAAARRATGIAHNDMEESLERVLSENWARKASSEALISFAAYLHRISQTITGLASIPGAGEWKQSREVAEALQTVHQHLLDLESDFRYEPGPVGIRGPAVSFPAGIGSGQSIPQHRQDVALPSAAIRANLPGLRQLVRLDRQAQVMRRHSQALRTEAWVGSV